MQSHHTASNDVLLKLKFTPTSKLTDNIYAEENGKQDDVSKHNDINGNGELHSNHIMVNGHSADVRS